MAIHLTTGFLVLVCLFLALRPSPRPAESTMRSEEEIRDAIKDLSWSIENGMTPPGCIAMTKGELAALLFVLDEEPAGDNLSWLLDAIRNERVRLSM
jgi:hypothetical protein